MRIGGIGGPAIGATARRATPGQREPDVAEGRALIPVTAAAPAERSPTMTRHPAAPFLAHLIATQQQAPQTRARRRAAPGEAIAIYGAMTAPRANARRSLGKRA
jgi:hypothetical protein